MNKQVSLVLVSIFIVVLLLGTVSALDWDNKKQFTLDDSTSRYGKINIYNSFFLGLGTGAKLWQAELKYNTDTCGEYCSAEKEITIYKDGALIDDVKFETINSDGSRIEQDIRSYQFYIETNGIKIPYEVGTNIKAGTYQVILEGQKKPTRTVDWQIQSNGKWTEEWALWTSNDVFNDVYSVHTFNQPNLTEALKDELGRFNSTENSGGDITLNSAGCMREKCIDSNNLGSGERVEFSRPFLNTSEFPISISLWYNITDATCNGAGRSILLGSGASGDITQDFMLGIHCAEGNVSLLGGPTAWNLNVVGTETTNKHEWNHIVLQFYSERILVYMNGILDINSSWGYSTMKFNPNFLFDGSNNDVNERPNQNVLIDELYIWNRTITGTEVSDLYNSGDGAFYGGVVEFNSPEDNYISPQNEVIFNCSATIGEEATIVNMSLWTNQSGTFQQENITTGLSGTTETTIWNHTIVGDGNYLWNCQACDSDGDCGFATLNRTITIDTIVPELTINLPTTLEDYAYVGENEPLNWTYTDPHLGSCWYNYNGTDVDVNCIEGNATFILEKDNYNMTFYANDSVNNLNETFFNWSYKVLENSRNFSTLTYETSTQSYQVNVSANSSLTSTALIYGGTSYASTLSGDTYTTTITHSTNGTRELYWNFTYAEDIFSSYSSSQVVNSTEFNICNVSDYYLNTTFLNITFLDEETLTRIGGQIDTSTTEYWLGDGSVTEELIYSNLTNMSEYNFCFTPNGSTMLNTRTFQYSATGYPQRKYDDSTDLTSTITHKTLYLLSSADGIYATIQVVDENGDTLSEVEVTMERQFAGVWTIVGKETSDGAGAVTFWVNPDYDHRFTLEKDGCVTNTETIRPTQTTYTATINCLGVDDEIYIAPIEGIRYFLLPASGLLSTGNQNFSFQVVSSKDNIVNVKFEIVNGSGYVLDSLSSACASAGCTISKMYNVTSSQNIKGRYYVDLGDGYILVDGDAHWIEVDIPARDGTFKQFWLNLRGVFDEWHEEGEDTTNTSDFNRIVFIFLFLAIGIATFNKLTHFDSSNPGAFLIFLTAVIFMGSIAGHPDNGFFYLDNLTMLPFINNYLLTGFMLWMLASHYAGVQLQKHR